MASRSLLDKGLDHLSSHGVVRTVGATAKYLGETVERYSDSVTRMLEWDRGKGYPIALRLEAARRGFSAHSYVWLGLDRSDADTDRYLTSGLPIRRCNRGHLRPIDDKYVFQRLTEPHLAALPELYGTIDSGGYEPRESVPDHDGLADLLARTGRLVVKPTSGGKGEDVAVLRDADDGVEVNGRRVARSRLLETISASDEQIVTEFVQQHDYAAAIFPDATNTLRIFTLYDRESDEVHVVRGAHRFGSAASAPTDNWSRGGYCAPLDVDSGRVGRLLTVDGSPRTERECHPETGVQIEGIDVPDWDRARDLVTEAARLHRTAPLVGWDVVIGTEGPVLIEGNARPGKELLQLEEGALADPRIRALLSGD